jgi:polysaccharide deacetylase 2 family uncharacterized protein YibQ
MNNVKIFLDINKPLTFSILPNLRYSSKIAMLASEKGNDVILHLPLEPHRKGSSADLAAINSGMSNAEVLSRLDSAIKNIPDIKGVSNHEGSLATEDPRLMEVIIREIGAKGLFFLDSATSQRSICQGVAKTAGTRFAKRDIFLDNNPSVGAVKKEMETLTRLAFRKGRAVAICHDRKNTASALSEMMPKMAAEGVEFVPVSEFAK